MPVTVTLKKKALWEEIVFQSKYELSCFKWLQLSSNLLHALCGINERYTRLLSLERYKTAWPSCCERYTILALSVTIAAVTTKQLILTIAEQKFQKYCMWENHTEDKSGKLFLFRIKIIPERTWLPFYIVDFLYLFRCLVCLSLA